MHKLPVLLSEIAEEFDLKTALEFAQDFGGRRVCIPLTTRTKLKDKIEPELLNFLIHRYGGDKIEVPAYHNGSLKQRNALIYQLNKEGKSINEIVQATGASFATITRARKRLKQEEENPPPLLKILEG